jgi:hypothetical protein
MTDFLDLLEADLREAAGRRGRPQPRRRRPPRGAFKVIVALAVVALFVFAAARVLDRPDDERAAQPTPTATPTPAVTAWATPTPVPPVGHGATMMAATEGSPGLVGVMSAVLNGYLYMGTDSSGPTADPSLGTVVLYHPQAEGARDKARYAAYIEKIDDVRPITKADEAKLDFPADGADVIVVYGRERQQQMLDDPKICAPAGGEYKLCVSRADEQRFSALVRGDKPVFSTTGPPEPWWSWAALSPDGRSLVVEASDRCAFPHAWVWDAGANGGEALTNGVAQPLGWTTDGRAILFVPQPKPDAAEQCRADLPTGLYLVEPGGRPTRIGDDPAAKSIDPRTPEQLTG